MKDNIFFNILPERLGYYKTSHVITHPWLLAEYITDQLRFAWQRVFRGWDDRVLSGIDLYLANKIPEWLEELKKSNGISLVYFDLNDWDRTKQDWKGGAKEKAYFKRDNVINEIIDGFIAYEELLNLLPQTNEPTYKYLNKKFRRAIELLGEYFDSFWC